MWCDCVLSGQLKWLFQSFSVGLASQANRLTDGHTAGEITRALGIGTWVGRQVGEWERGRLVGKLAREWMGGREGGWMSEK